jgi:uncharacterized protein (TIGR00106 family)
MSVLVDLSIFPMDQGASVSAFVAPVVKLIRDSGLSYRLSPMGTTVEADRLEDALALAAQAHALLEEMGCERIYATLRIDSRKGAPGRLAGKVESVRERIGEVHQ